MRNKEHFFKDSVPTIRFIIVRYAVFIRTKNGTKTIKVTRKVRLSSWFYFVFIILVTKLYHILSNFRLSFYWILISTSLVMGFFLTFFSSYFGSISQVFILFTVWEKIPAYVRSGFLQHSEEETRRSRIVVYFVDYFNSFTLGNCHKNFKVI